MTLQNINKPNRKLFAVICGAVLCFILLMAASTTAYAAPQHGFGTGQGRTDTVNENDFHTNHWERFSYNYQFTSGSDHRFELGQPTTFSGFVPVDVYSVNMRRDAQVSLQPPRYGIFSGNIPTPPANQLFPQPVNPHFHQPFQLQDPNVDSRFDTLGLGVNAAPIGSTSNTHNVNAGDFLPPTSILPSAR